MPQLSTECGNCGVVEDDDHDPDIQRTSDGYYACEDCRETCTYCDREYQYLSDHQDYHCANCGDWFCGNQDYTWCDECEQYRCEDCSECECSSMSHVVHQWDYKPRNYKPKGEWRRTPTDPAPNPLLGMELEVGRSSSDIVPAVQRVDPHEDHLYMKHDGSISGVEIVSHPATLDWSREFPYKEMLDDLRHSGCHVDDGYGLHVHVSRNAFRSATDTSAVHQMSWLMFMYRNTDALELLARRSSERWASFAKPRKGELKRKALGADDGSRYVAVNCNNARTYELRFFASTLQPQEFFAALEFADASVRYTRQIKTHDILRGKALEWDRFADWVAEHDYSSLTAELSKF